MWLFVAIVIAGDCSWAVAILGLSFLSGWGCLPWYGDGLVVGRRVVVAVSGVVGVVVVG